MDLFDDDFSHGSVTHSTYRKIMSEKCLSQAESVHEYDSQDRYFSESMADSVSRIVSGHSVKDSRMRKLTDLMCMRQNEPSVRRIRTWITASKRSTIMERN